MRGRGSFEVDMVYWMDGEGLQTESDYHIGRSRSSGVEVEYESNWRPASVIDQYRIAESKRQRNKEVGYYYVRPSRYLTVKELAEMKVDIEKDARVSLQEKVLSDQEERARHKKEKEQRLLKMKEKEEREAKERRTEQQKEMALAEQKRHEARQRQAAQRDKAAKAALLNEAQSIARTILNIPTSRWAKSINYNPHEMVRTYMGGLENGYCDVFEVLRWLYELLDWCTAMKAIEQPQPAASP